MKARSKIIYIIVIILLVTLIVNKYYQKQQKYEEYVNEKLNWNFYKICDYMMNSNAIIENTVENGYILQSDLEYLKDQYFYYIRSLDEVNDISRKFYKFNFFSVEKYIILVESILAFIIVLMIYLKIRNMTLTSR